MDNYNNGPSLGNGKENENHRNSFVPIEMQKTLNKSANVPRYYRENEGNIKSLFIVHIYQFQCHIFVFPALYRLERSLASA